MGNNPPSTFLHKQLDVTFPNAALVFSGLSAIMEGRCNVRENHREAH